MPVVDWKVWLVNASNFAQIQDLTESLHDKKLSLQLNSSGKATGWMNLLDPLSSLIVEHQTALLFYRNGMPVWSGPIMQTGDDSTDKSDRVSITAMGWFQLLMQRILHTGAEFQTMLANFRAGLSYVPGIGTRGGYTPGFYIGDYAGIGTESATQLVYSNKAMGAIAVDLLTRANIDIPTGIQLGALQSTNSINLTLQQFQNVGQQILRLANLESGFDFDIDPLTRYFNVYNQQIKSGISGKGIDRGQGVLFTYPGNCISAGRSRDGTRTANRVEATGQYGIGRADDVQSQGSNGLFEANESLSDVVETNTLIAFANAEVAVRKNPWQVVKFTPRSVIADDVVAHGVPQPFADYAVGDVVYATINRGPRLQIGINNPQPVRIYGFDVDITDDGVEKVSSIQTQYTASS